MLFSTEEFFQISSRLQDLLKNQGLFWGVTDGSMNIAEDPLDIWKLVATWLPCDDPVFYNKLPYSLQSICDSNGFNNYYPFQVWNKLVDCLEQFIKEGGSDRSYFVFQLPKEFDNDTESPLDPDLEELFKGIAELRQLS